MKKTSNKRRPSTAAIPPDDLRRSAVLARPNKDQSLPHFGLVGDTYTVLLSGGDTAGRYCLFDMHIPPGGGPPPHGHDFEETFTILAGELEVTFRGKKSIVRAGETVHVPANAPHQIHNRSRKPVRALCICAPAGQERFFKEVGVGLPNRTTPPPKPSSSEAAAFKAKAVALAAKYRTEFLKP